MVHNISAVHLQVLTVKPKILQKFILEQNRFFFPFCAPKACPKII